MACSLSEMLCIEHNKRVKLSSFNFDTEISVKNLDKMCKTNWSMRIRVIYVIFHQNASWDPFLLKKFAFWKYPQNSQKVKGGNLRVPQKMKKRHIFNIWGARNFPPLTFQQIRQYFHTANFLSRKGSRKAFWWKMTFKG